MQLSEFSIEYLGNFIAGDIEGLPYRGGPKLVKFFNQFGAREVYPMGGGFPTRRIFAQNKLREINGTPQVLDAISAALDPREFVGTATTVDDAATMLAAQLKYDGLEIVKEGEFYRARGLSSGRVKLDAPVRTPDELTQLNIDDNIRKCGSKLSDGDFTGAITNARSLIESVLIGFEKELDNEASEYDGDLVKLYRRVQKLLGMETDRKDISEPLRQILSGLTSVINGLASVRNKMGDAHATSYRPSRHHAKLAVNAATTVADFLFETKNYQQKRGTLRAKE